MGTDLGDTSETSEKRALQSALKPGKGLKMPSWWQLRQMRDLYHYEYLKIEQEIGQKGGRIAYTVAQSTGGNLTRFKALFARRQEVLAQLHYLEPLLGLNICSNIK